MQNKSPITNPKLNYLPFWMLGIRIRNLFAPITIGIGFFGFGISDAFSQSHQIDSLTARLRQTIPDTDRIITLNTLGQEFAFINPDSSISLANEGLSRSIKAGWKRGTAISLGDLGIYYYLKSDYAKAIDCYLKVIGIDEELGNKQDIAKQLGNIGIVYMDQCDYPKALTYYLKALKTDEELGNKHGTAADLGNIGSIYLDEADYPKALDYYFKALKIAEELEDNNFIAAALGNIGIVYKEQADYPKALEYYLRYLKMADKFGNKSFAATALGNIANVYARQGGANPDPFQSEELYGKALDYYFKALKIDEELNNKNGITRHLGNIGTLYVKLGKFNDACIYLYRALAVSDSIGSTKLEKEQYEYLSYLYEKSTIPLPDSAGGRLLNKEEMRLRALHYFKNYLAVRDSIFSEESKKQLVRKELTYQFEKKEAAIKAEQDTKDAVAAAESKKQKIIIWSIVSGLMLVVVFAGFILRSLQVTSKQKRIIEEQKKFVEDAHQNTIDSIEYAKRIQTALLTSEDYIKGTGLNYFLFFRPKDIVSGDFYWVVRSADCQSVLLAIADCTGHGVSGAFLSLLGISFLNEIVIERKTESPEKILDALRSEIIQRLNPDGREDIKDGMEMGLCRLTFAKFQTLEKLKVIEYSSANIRMALVRGKELFELERNESPVGVDFKVTTPFTLHRLNLVPGDMLYAFSDGYADQAGGPKNKKFMRKNLNALLQSVATNTVEEQKEIIAKAFDDWKGGGEQIDDVTIIGIRV